MLLAFPRRFVETGFVTGAIDEPVAMRKNGKRKTRDRGARDQR
jgi:hypothetical protein